MVNILIVEDESIVAMEIGEYVESLGYTVSAICSSANCAYLHILDNRVDIIIMDISLENSSGIDAAKDINKIKDIPIIYLTSYVDNSTIDSAISTNPVAYLTKPFNQNELVAALKLAKKHTNADSVIDLDKNFSYSFKVRELYFKQEKVHLSRREKELLELFINRSNQVLSYETIEYSLWPNITVNDNTRRILLSRLRNKLNHNFIITLPKEGYIFNLNQTIS